MVGFSYEIDNRERKPKFGVAMEYVTSSMMAWSIINELKIAEMRNKGNYDGIEEIFGFFKEARDIVDKFVVANEVRLKERPLDDFLPPGEGYKENHKYISLVLEGRFGKRDPLELRGLSQILERLQHQKPVPVEQIQKVENFFREYEDFCDSKSHGGNI